MFATYGIPVRVRSDGGPQYSGNDWLEYLTRKGSERRLSSPFNPTGNAHAESGVKALKSLVKKTGGSTKSEAFCDGLREWRNTPKAHGLSPSELMFGRNIRSTVPTLPSEFKVPDNTEMKEKDAAQKEKIREHFDSRTRPLSVLEVGDTVWIQNPVSKKWDRSGTVKKVGPYRDYDVQVDGGRVLNRNRRYLRPKLIRFEDEEQPTRPSPSPPTPTPRRGSRQRRTPDRYGTK